MKVDYGLRALVYLARNYGRGTSLTADIAASQAIPLPFLKQLLTTLRKSGLVQSRRGRQGGHALAQPPTAIELYTAVAALEGTPALLDCVTEPKDCTLSAFCSQRLLWKKVGAAVEKTLKSTTLADLAQEQERLADKGSYFI